MLRSDADLLGDLRVVELDGGIPTAYAGRLLRDAGAQVTRRTAGGDSSLRDRGRAADARWPVTPGALFDALNAEKTAEPAPATWDGPELAEIARRADIVLAGRDVLDAGDVSALRTANPRLVVAVCGVSAAAPPGQRWLHLHATARSGVSALIGQPDREPLPPPFELALYPVAANLASAALAAHVGSLRSGQGQLVEVDAEATMFSFMWTAARIRTVSAGTFTRNGRRFPGSGGAYPFGLFPCADGYVACIGRSAKDWRAFVGILGDPEWSRDPRFADPVEIARSSADEADALVIPELRRHTRAELFARAQQVGFPLAPVNSALEVLDVEQFNRRESFGPELEVAGQKVRLLRRSSHFERPAEAPRVAARPAAARPGTAAPAAAGERSRSLLAGLRVLDLSWVWSGPMAGAALADLGADVLKLENPGRLDNARLRGRPIRDGRPVEGPIVELSTYFHQNNRGKRSVFLDFKDPAGAEIFRRLVRVSDVVLENLTPGVFDRAGLGYSDVVAENPRIIWVAASAVGRTGPLVGLRAYAPIMTSYGGLESLAGYDDDPVVGMLGCGMGDANAGSHVLFALTAALAARERDGRGRFVDLSQIETSAAIMVEPLVEAQLRGQALGGTGDAHPDVAPHGHFACAGDDVWVAIAAVDDEMWRRLARVVGGDELAHDGRFATAAARADAAAVLTPVIARWTAARPRDAVLRDLQAHQVSVAPVLDVMEARGFFTDYLQEIEHPVTGPDELVRVPWQLSDTPARIAGSAPLVGEHTDEVLRDVLGLDSAQRTAYLDRFRPHD
ncbi:CaiB/BaiF CoA-transferase family protein [Pseudofrankia inefficax]|uniref:L-carnitine dehydratase/bile acid-inducible protein F n=1 Tax=Pseudofrankia inefficax (strain DSM 45817 / CECT 9037 / DDB 130130 / EuI1c) TaxID=298654 RepID=E3J930_PSEI1|nr:CoA transferase [Pseudofrankia inefficax]ADP80909.1 L-carnitine dehydratase/bile acid-inducible protein F [Pseudofrankia inefficax]